MDFKVGDKVRFINKLERNQYLSAFFPVDGYIGEVVSVNEISCVVNWGKDSGVSAGPQHDYSWFCNNECLELVEEEKEEMENSHNFKVGDMVIFLSEKKHKEQPTFYPSVGTIGRVIEVDEEDADCENIYDIKVDWGKESGTGADYQWWCNHNHIKAAESTIKFIIGDRVIFTNRDKHKDNPRHFPPVGTVGEVIRVDPYSETLDIKVKWETEYEFYNPWHSSVDFKKYDEEVKEVKKENVMKYEVGEKVKFIDENAHEEDPGTYPPVGTIGTIVEIDPRDKEWTCRIDWGEKSGVERNPAYNGCVWWAPNSFIEKLPWWVSPDNEVASDETEEVEETDDVAALAELVIKKQMEIQKLKEDNEKIVARNAELTELVAAFRNKGLEIVNLGVNKNV